CPTTGTVGTPITQFTLTAAGGQAPYTWAVSSPTWLQLGTATGAIAQFSGTPTTAGPAAVSVRLTDSIGTAAGTFSCSIPISAALQLSVLSPSNPDGQPTGTCQTTSYPAGSPLSIPVQATGGSGGYTFTSVTPAWLTYNATAGAFTGTPPTTGIHPIAFRVTDSSGRQANFSCNITVAAGLTISGTCPATPVAGTPLTVTLTAQGGVGPFNWTVVSPSWLRVATNGAAAATFTGTPPINGAADINITVTDSIQSTLARFTCRTEVQTKLQVSAVCPTRPYPTGARLELPLQATGGTGNYTYRVTNPSWLTYQASNSSVVGVPPAVGIYTFSIVVTDSSGAQATFSCNLSVGTPLSLAGTCPASAPSDALFGISLTALGGTAPYTFTVLYPNWLQLRAVRANSADFTGLPASGAASSDITILVGDAIGSSATPFSCRVDFQAPPPVPPLNVTASCQTIAYPAGLRVEIPVVLTGGNGENVFRNISPSWLTYDPGLGKLVGVPPAAGVYSVSAVAADAAGLQSTFGCSISVAPRLVATGVCQETVTTGNTLDLNVSVQGGTGPYRWTVISPSWLQVKTTDAGTATLSGVAPAPGPVDLQLRVVDSIQSLPASFGCGLRIDFPALKVDPPPIQTVPSGAGCPSDPVPAGQGLTLPFSVAGGSGSGTAGLWLQLRRGCG
ncbi:MAG: putative Ig domain-containing protein, partial [Bryobacteraceae bacterium]|nr:putative Ig domain-containing protein [Bryobacteraceae bacterium]